jgi:multiple sugar transport system permease protein
MSVLYKRIKRITLVLVLIAISLLWLMPLLWMISTSLRLPKHSFNLPPAFLPTEFHWENYRAVFSKLPFARFFLNSLVVTVCGTVLQVIVSAMAAYAFARVPFAGKNFWFVIIISGLMIPVQSTIVPKFLIMKEFGLINTLTCLILPAVIDPLAIFLLRQSMLTIPKSYDEAAYIDGANRVRIFTSIILPMTSSSIAVVVATRSLVLWNDFFQPLVFLSGNKCTTLPLGLTILKGQMGNGSISIVLAGVVLSFIAPLMMYVAAQKYLLSATLLSGMKS